MFKKILVKIKNNNFKSAHVVLFRDGKVLILKRSKTDAWMPEHYGLPGGKLETGEELGEAVSRECQEETSIKVDPADLIFLSKVSNNKEHAFFCCSKFTGEPKLDFEHDDFQWVNPKNLSNYKVVPDLPEIINAALEELR
jgi:8-oxo-dGTP diphosphatase